MITVPTVYSQGDAGACDLLAGADGQERCFSHSYARVVLPGVEHFSHREQPATVARVPQEILRT